MKPQFIKNLNRIFTGRVARNLYFWIILFLIKYSDADDQQAYPLWFYYVMMIVLMGFFALLTYINNLVLVPRLLFRKKRVLYFISAGALTFSIAYIYTCAMKWLPVRFPGFDALQVSIVMSPVTPDYSFMGVLDDMQSYFVIMVMWMFIFTLFWYFNTSGERIRQMEEVISRHRETELAFLKNQLNPHFLFNTLNNLYGLSIKKSDDTPGVILKLSSVLRYILYESNTPAISFDKEKEVIEAYIDIELLRLPRTPDVRFTIARDRSCNIPPLLWLPVLENVFKHGRTTGDMEVDFRFTAHQKVLTIYSRNNIPAVPSVKKSEGGIGISNLRKRLELLYPEKHQLNIRTEDNFYIIEVSINLN